MSGKIRSSKNTFQRGRKQRSFLQGIIKSFLPVQLYGRSPCASYILYFRSEHNISAAVECCSRKRAIATIPKDQAARVRGRFSGGGEKCERNVASAGRGNSPARGIQISFLRLLTLLIFPRSRLVCTLRDE